MGARVALSYALKHPARIERLVLESGSPGLLHRREEHILAPLSPTGSTTRTWYSLTGDFGHEARKAQGQLASKERRARLGRKKKPKFEESKS